MFELELHVHQSDKFEDYGIPSSVHGTSWCLEKKTVMIVVVNIGSGLLD